MKILCISDTTESPAFSESVKEIFKDTDLVISCGDIPEQSYDYITTSLRKDLFYVYGNHNLGNWKPAQEGPIRTTHSINAPFYGNIIDGKCIRTKQGLLIAGLGGCMRYNKGKNQYTEKQMARRIQKLRLKLLYNKLRYGRYLDILVTHAPVYHLDDRDDQCHRGYQCFIDFINRYQPKYLVHGHCHLEDMNQQREKLLGNTKVINAYSWYVLEDDFTNTKTRGRNI